MTEKEKDQLECLLYGLYEKDIDMEPIFNHVFKLCVDYGADAYSEGCRDGYEEGYDKGYNQGYAHCQDMYVYRPSQ